MLELDTGNGILAVLIRRDLYFPPSGPTSPILSNPSLSSQVRSVIAHDEVVMSVVPFLLSLYSHEEEANSSAMTGVGKSKKSDILC